MGQVGRMGKKKQQRKRRSRNKEMNSWQGGLSLVLI